MNLARENLPANIISKVQFYDDTYWENANGQKSNYAILNIKLKKNVKKGWFGKVYGGAGINKKYESGAIMNLFKDTLQVGILGYANNINKAGFGIGDIKSIGGFSRNINSQINYEGKTFLINGISFGGAGDGIQISKGVGFNLNHHPVKKLDINFNYFYTNSINSSESNTLTQQSIKDVNYYTQNGSKKELESSTHYLAASLSYNPNSFTKMIVDARVKFYDQQINSNFSQKSLLHDIQTSYSTYALEGDEKTTPKYFNFTISSKPKNKRISLVFNSLLTDESNLIKGQYINQEDTLSHLSDYVRDIKNFGFSNKLLLNYSLKNSTSVSLNAEYKFRREKLVFTNFSTPENMMDTILNSRFSRQINWLTLNPAYNFKIKKTSFKIGATANYLSLKHYNIKYLRESYYSPSLQISSGDFVAEYGENIVIPSSFYFVNYQDINDPFSFYFKNPYLEPALSKFITINFDHFNFEKGFSVFSYLQAKHTRKPIIFIKTLNYEDGTLRQMAANADYQNTIGFSLNYSGSIAYNQKKNKIKYSISFNPDINNGYITFNGENSRYLNLSITPSLNLSSELNESVEVSTFLKYFYYGSRFKNSFFRNISIGYLNVEPEIIYRKNDYIIEGVLSISLHKEDLVSGNSFLLNIAVSKLLLKNRNLQVKISAYDVLNKNKGIITSFTDNAVTTGERLELGRFVMASIIFNIRNFRVVKPGGKNSLLYF